MSLQQKILNLPILCVPKANGTNYHLTYNEGHGHACTAAAKLAGAASAELEAMREEVARAWFVLKEFGHHPGRTDDTLSECLRRALRPP